MKTLALPSICFCAAVAASLILVVPTRADKLVLPEFVGRDVQINDGLAPSYEGAPANGSFQTVNVQELIEASIFDNKRGQNRTEPVVEFAPEPIQEDVPDLTEEEKPAYPIAVFSGYAASDGKISALVDTKSNGELWLEVGDKVGEWKVVGISEDQISLSYEGEIQISRRAK